MPLKLNNFKYQQRKDAEDVKFYSCSSGDNADPRTCYACSYGASCGGGGGSCSCGASCGGGGGTCSYGASCGGGGGRCSYGANCSGG